MNIKNITFIFFFLLLVNMAFAQKVRNKGFDTDFARFEQENQKGIDTTRLALFVGSSTFTRWRDMTTYFPMSNVLNRGFGGSKMTDVIYYLDQVIYPYNPSQIVLYEGDNDLGTGVSVEKLYADLLVFLRVMEIRYPKTQIVLVSVKHSPFRRKVKAAIDEYNLKMKVVALDKPNVKFVDISNITLNKDGSYNKALFTSDSLHVNEHCYLLYAKLIEPLLIKRK